MLVAHCKPLCTEVCSRQVIEAECFVKKFLLEILALEKPRFGRAYSRRDKTIGVNFCLR